MTCPQGTSHCYKGQIFLSGGECPRSGPEEEGAGGPGFTGSRGGRVLETLVLWSLRGLEKDFQI